jgi:putative ABC transport system permease protein
VAAWSAGQTAQRGYRELFDSLAGAAGLEVFAPGETAFDPALATGLDSVPGVREAIPIIMGGASIRGPNGQIAVVLVGIRGDEAHPNEAEAWLGTGLASSTGLAPGDCLRLWCPAGPAELTVIPPPAAQASGPASDITVTTSLATAQRLFGLGPKVNRVRLILEEGANSGVVEAEVVRRLPVGLSVRVPAARAEVASGLRAAATQGLVGLTALAIASAGYVVLNSVRMNLLSRLPEMALLRTLGASVSQVEGVFVRQAMLLGLAGSATGVAAGLALVFGITRVVGSVTGVPLNPGRVGWSVLALGLGLGLGLAITAVWLPARGFCRRPPLELFRPLAVKPGSATWDGTGHATASFSLAVAMGMLTASVEDWFPAGWGRELFPLMLVLLLVSVAAWTAPLFPRLLRICEGPASRVFGVEGVLAVRQLGRQPVRTVRTTGVVFVAVTMAVGFGHTVLNTLADIRVWCGRAIPADFLVRGSMPDPGFFLTAFLPEGLGDELTGLDGVKAVDTIAFIPTHIGGEPALVLARTFPADQTLPLDLRGADPTKIRQGLADGGAVIADGLAQSLHARPGDCVMLETPQGRQPVRVVGTATEYAGGGNAIYLDRNAANRLFGPVGVHVFLVTARADSQGPAYNALARFCAQRGLLLQKNQELRRQVDNLTQALTAALWALLALMFAVAGLGVGSMVTVNAREQVREMHLLRAVGMVRRRIRRLAGLQALFLTITGLMPGLAWGVVLTMILARTIQGLWGYRVPLRIEWELIGGVVGMTLFVGVISGLLASTSRPPSSDTGTRR